MSSIKLTPNVSGTGIFSIAAPATNTNRTMTLADSDGTIYIAPGDGIQTLASGAPTARTITAGTGISVANGNGVAGNPTITNSGVTSVTASTGISASASTGGVTLTNTGVTSIVAGTNITISGGTGAVTINAAGGSTTYAAVGTYLIAYFSASANTTYAGGATIAGSSLLRQTDYGSSTQFLGSLNQSNCFGFISGAPAGTTNLGLSGTWQFMSHARNSYPSNQNVSALFVRIA